MVRHRNFSSKARKTSVATTGYPLQKEAKRSGALARCAVSRPASARSSLSMRPVARTAARMGCMARVHRPAWAHRIIRRSLHIPFARQRVGDAQLCAPPLPFKACILSALHTFADQSQAWSGAFWPFDTSNCNLILSRVRAYAKPVRKVSERAPRQLCRRGLRSTWMVSLTSVDGVRRSVPNCAQGSHPSLLSGSKMRLATHTSVFCRGTAGRQACGVWVSLADMMVAPAATCSS